MLSFNDTNASIVLKFIVYPLKIECETDCPKEISLGNIARMNREYLMATLKK